MYLLSSVNIVGTGWTYVSGDFSRTGLRENYFTE